MGCKKTLDFASPTGAHLSMYWTMDEAGAANKVDSTAGVVWPVVAGTVAAPGLFSNGTQIAAKVRGLSVTNSPTIIVSQATSKGISFWYWVKIVAYGNTGVFCHMDTSGAGTNDFSLFLQSTGAGFTFLDFWHQNNTDLAEITQNLVQWTLGTWHMVAAVYDKTAQKILLYVDGLLVDSLADAFVYPDLTGTIWALVSPNPAGTNPNFVFDELGLCLNGALTQAQITSLWNVGAGMTWPTITSVVPYP